MSVARKIIEHFDAAAAGYDEAASLQQQVAQELVAMADLRNPEQVLDIGAGTGLVAQAVHARWPQAFLTALDPAPQMLRAAQDKIRNLKVVAGDATALPDGVLYDAVFSSMMLHWLPDPAAVLQQWQKALKPSGKMFVALLAQGSFQEWRDLCRAHGLQDGLWVMPDAGFADGLNVKTRIKPITIVYESAHAFLRRLKKTGAATGRSGHAAFSVAQMRNILRATPRPFAVTYNVLYIENSPQGRV